MKAVGVKLLKNNLSRYLREVRGGEVIYVTDREEVIAEIHRPTTYVPTKVSRWEAFLNREERSRRILRGAPGAPPLRSLEKLSRPRKPIRLQSLLDEIKEDRFE